MDIGSIFISNLIASSTIFILVLPFIYQRFDFSSLANGKWTVEIDARGYGIDPGVAQFAFHDYFEMTLTITKPCVQFKEIHEDGECTDLSVLEGL